MTTLLVVLKERHCVMEERARDWDDEDRREKEIRRLFRLGLKRCCATAIWAKLAEHAGDALTERLILEDADHTFGTKHPWGGASPAMDEVFDATTRFLARHLR